MISNISAPPTWRKRKKNLSEALLFELEWGAYLAHLADYGRLPQRPEIDPCIVWVYQAFVRLAPSRNMNGRIPFSEIAAYAEKYAVEDFDFFLEIINHLDAVKQPGRKNADTSSEY